MALNYQPHLIMGNFKNELQNFTSIPRDLVFDKNLSDRARFVFVFMACKPEDWDFFLEPMAKEIGYSVDTLRKYINELVASGWLVKGEQQKQNGMFGAVQYTLKATKNTESEKVRDGKTCTLTDKRDNNCIIVNKNEREEEKEYKEKFSAFVLLYKKLTGKHTRGIETEFKDFKTRHKDWKKIIPLLPYAIKRETQEREEAKSHRRFFPEPKMLQTYLGKQRAWEMYVKVGDDIEQLENEYRPFTDGEIRWSETYQFYIYTGMDLSYIPDGYNNNDRPDGATIMLNNARGYMIWDATNKKWKRKREY